MASILSRPQCVNSMDMIVSMTWEKKILALITHCIQDHLPFDHYQISSKSEITATKLANPFAILFSKWMEIDNIEELSSNKFCYNAPLSLSKQAGLDLQWLRENLKNSSASVMQCKPDWHYVRSSNCVWGHWWWIISSFQRRSIPAGGKTKAVSLALLQQSFRNQSIWRLPPSGKIYERCV